MNNKLYRQGKLIIISCLLLFLLSCQPKTVDREIKIKGTLSRIISGQSLEVIIPEKQNNPVKVRIIGIDIPKSEQLFSTKSPVVKIQELIGNNNITLEIETNQSDRFGRLLAHVWHNEILISEQLLKEGYATLNTKYPHKYSQRLLYAREYARILGYGIWGE